MDSQKSGPDSNNSQMLGRVDGFNWWTIRPNRIQEEDSTGARSFQGINDFKDCFAGNCGLCERRDAEGIRRQ